MIRRAGPADTSALSELKHATFRETFLEDFGIPYPPADLALFEAEHHAPAAVAASLGDPQLDTWVAEQDGQLIGYVQVGPCKLPHPDARPAHGELRQIYVSRATQGRGHGRDLLRLALDHIETTRGGPIWLGVWSGNERAQALYRACGFGAVGRYLFAVGRWLDEELIFRRD